MKIYYLDDNVKPKLCKLFMIEEPVKSYILFKITMPYGKNEFDKLNSYLEKIFSSIGCNEDVLFTESDDCYAYGKIGKDNRSFRISLNKSFRLNEKYNISLRTERKMDDSIDTHAYLIQAYTVTRSGVSFAGVSIKEIWQEHRDKKQTIMRYSMEENGKYAVDIEKDNYKLNCCLYNSPEISNSERKLENYFFNFDSNKGLFQIFSDVLQLTGLTIEELNHINVRIQRDGANRYYQNEEYIAYNEGKLACLGARKDGNGYHIEDRRIRIESASDDPDTFDIDFDSDNAIFKMGKEMFTIPLDILKTTDIDYYTDPAMANHRFGKAISKRIRPHNVQ